MTATPLRRLAVPARAPLVCEPVNLAAHRQGWLLPRGWALAHWFERSETGLASACGRAHLKLPPHGPPVSARRDLGAPTCSRCIAMLR